MKKVLLFLTFLFSLFFSCMENEIHDLYNVEILFDEALFTEEGIHFRWLELTSPQGPPLRWHPGDEKKLNLPLSFGSYNLMQRYFFIDTDGQEQELTQVLPILYQLADQPPLVIDLAGLVPFKRQILFDFNMLWDGELTKVDLLIQGGSFKEELTWSPGEEKSLSLEIPRGSYMADITYNSINYSGAPVSENEILTWHITGDNRLPLRLTSPCFSGGFIRADAPGTIRIFSPDGQIPPAGPEEGRTGMILNLARNDGIIPDIFIMEDNTLLIYHKGVNEYWYCHQKSNGTYDPPQRITGWPAGFTPLYSGDLNGDGEGDLLLIKTIYGTTSSCYYKKVFGQKGNLFSFSEESHLFISGIENPYITAADLNRDGVIDLVYSFSPAGEPVNTRIEYLIGSANGSFAGTPQFLISLNHAANGLSAADLNRDGWPELLAGAGTGNPDCGQTIILNGGEVYTRLEGSPDFLPQTETALPGRYSGTLQAGDLNSDGWPDLILTAADYNNFTYNITVYINNKAGNFPAGRIYSWITGGENSLASAIKFFFKNR